jgi:N6-L-threonylcarbamoyladenine synthase
MIVLGVESSCDETSAAVIKDNNVLSNVISSQLIHSEFGGVVPELASRAHIRLIAPIVREALAKARVGLNEIDGLAVTNGPGLVGALLVGLNYVKGLSLAVKKPFIGVNHIEGHIYGTLISQESYKFPVIFLIVSGGHTQIVLMKDELTYEILGKTRDDAVGEAFDKGGKMMGLGYPAGPVIDKLAKEGDKKFHKFPHGLSKYDTFDFSYSGLKTSLLVYLQDKSPEFIKENLPHICASYQAAAVDVLVEKTIKAANRYKVERIGIAGGVAANSYLRQELGKACAQQGKELYIPELVYCTDNAAMIARVGLEYLKRGEKSPQSLNAFPSMKLTSYKREFDAVL